MHCLMHVDVVVRRYRRNIEMLSVGLAGRRTRSLCSGYVVGGRCARVKRLFLVRLKNSTNERWLILTGGPGNWGRNCVA